MKISAQSNVIQFPQVEEARPLTLAFTNAKGETIQSVVDKSTAMWFAFIFGECVVRAEAVLCFVGTTPWSHETGPWMKRRRVCEITINKELANGILYSMEYQLLASFNSSYTDEELCALNDRADGIIVADEGDYDYDKAILLVPTENELEFKLIYVEC